MRFFASDDDVRRAREAFDAAGYTLAAITERMGPHVFSHLAVGERAPLLRSTRFGDRLDVLARLFLIGEAVPLADAHAALAPLPIERWQAGGVVSVEGDDVTGLLAIRPIGEPHDWLVAHDRARRDGTLRADHVIGLGASTVALAGATIRRPIDAALDLGTGCGIQALHATTHSRQVVASDLNRRAVACATLTMELNGIRSVSVRHGDLFGPVAGERFDLVVANPPFVVSPAQRYLFRDSGRPLDDVCRTIVTEVPQVLHDGGHCQLLASWVHLRGEDWRDRLAAWFAGTGCDALVLQREQLGPAAHAASWLRQTERSTDWPEFDEWVDHYDEQGVEAIGFGLITMRKRGDDRTPWFRAEVAEQDFAMPCGDHLGAAFELAELLQRTGDDELLAMPFAVAPDVVLDERCRPGPDAWTAVDRRLRQTAGLCREGTVDEVVASIVGGCDGQRSLVNVLDTVGTDPGRAIPIVRDLIGQAFLLPVFASAANGRPDIAGC